RRSSRERMLASYWPKRTTSTESGDEAMALPIWGECIQFQATRKESAGRSSKTLISRHVRSVRDTCDEQSIDRNEHLHQKCESAETGPKLNGRLIQDEQHSPIAGLPSRPTSRQHNLLRQDAHKGRSLACEPLLARK